MLVVAIKTEIHNEVVVIQRRERPTDRIESNNQGLVAETGCTGQTDLLVRTMLGFETPPSLSFLIAVIVVPLRGVV